MNRKKEGIFAFFPMIRGFRKLSGRDTKTTPQSAQEDSQGGSSGQVEEERARDPDKRRSSDGEEGQKGPQEDPTDGMGTLNNANPMPVIMP